MCCSQRTGLAEMGVLYAVGCRITGCFPSYRMSAGPVHGECPGPWTVLEGGKSAGQVAGVSRRSGADEEEPIGAAGGTHGSDRLDGYTAGQVGQPAAGLLIDGRAAIGMVVDDEGLAALGEGSDLVEIGVLDRLRAVRGWCRSVAH